VSAATVRALVVHGAGDARLEERPAPVPGPGEVAVRVAYGGICGSDVHYWRHGRVGDARVREPLVLGHEVVGTVAAVGPNLEGLWDGATGPGPGTPVAVHPATPCGACPECRADRRTVCRAVRYLGSAAHLPHVQGGLTDVLVVLGLLPPGDVPVPGNLVVTRELEVAGTYRFDGELHDVLPALADGSLPAAPVVTHVLPLADAAGALELAADPRRSGKVLLDLTDPSAGRTS
jgi:threonine dehydrogenase-like Zn-dependent dehydrogenase